MRTVRLGVLLLASGLTTTAAAQSLTASGTFIPAATFNPTTALWVAVDTVRGSGRVSVDVRDNTGSVLAAPLDFDMEKPGPKTLPARLSRLLKPSSALSLAIDVKPYGNDVPVVRAAGLAGTQPEALAVVNVKIDDVKCIGTACPVCYTLQQSAEVTLDTYPDVGGKPVRTAFRRGQESAGNHRGEWNQVGDDNMQRSNGRYYIKLHAANANGEGADVVSTFFSLPPEAPGACR